MISKLSMDSAVKVFGKLDAIGVKAKPLPGSPLEGLVDLTTPLMGVLPTGMSGPEIINKTISTENAQGENAYNGAIDEAINVISGVVNEQMDVIRGQVLPMISEAVERANDAVARTELADYSIQSYFLAEIHDNAFVHDLLSPWEGTPHMEVGYARGFGPHTEGELLEKIKTGNPAVDDQLAAMIAAHPQGWIVDVYDRYFGRTGEKTFRGQISYPELDALLAAFMLYCSFRETPPEEYPAPLAVYEGDMTRMIGQLAGAIHATHEKWDRLRVDGIVVMAWPISSDIPEKASDAVINVIGDNYNNFLGAGGSPEVVIGAAVSNRPYNGNQLIENKEQYLRAYEDYRLRYENSKANRLGSILRSALAESLGNSATNMPVDLFPEGVNASKAQAMIMSYLSNISDHAITEETYKVAREVIAKVLFPHFDALTVLEHIDHEMERRNIEPAVAATLVSVDDILDHLVSQVVVG